MPAVVEIAGRAPVGALIGANVVLVLLDAVTAHAGRECPVTGPDSRSGRYSDLVSVKGSDDANRA